MTNAFEYGDALLADSAESKETEKEKAQEEEGESPRSPLPIASNQPYLNLATYVFYILL